MKKYIPEPEFDDYFDRLWNSTQSEFFKCEACDVYTEPDEDEFLALFRAGELERLRKALKVDVVQEGSVWQQASARNIDFMRVHVFSEPLSEYLQFELIAYEIQAKVGERIWMVPLRALSKDEQKDLKDFMLFDLMTALIVEHNAEGQIVGATFTEERADIDRLSRLRQRLLNVGIRLEDFLARQHGSNP